MFSRLPIRAASRIVELGHGHVDALGLGDGCAVSGGAAFDHLSEHERHSEHSGTDSELLGEWMGQPHRTSRRETSRFQPSTMRRRRRCPPPTVRTKIPRSRSPAFSGRSGYWFRNVDRYPQRAHRYADGHQWRQRHGFRFGSGTLTLSGTKANLNAYLASASRPSYVPVADHNGTVTLTMTTSDGTLTATGTSTITITAVADIANDSVTTNEDTPVTFSPLANDSSRTAALPSRISTARRSRRRQCRRYERLGDAQCQWQRDLHPFSQCERREHVHLHGHLRRRNRDCDREHDGHGCG